MIEVRHGKCALDGVICQNAEQALHLLEFFSALRVYRLL